MRNLTLKLDDAILDRARHAAVDERLCAVVAAAGQSELHAIKYI